MGLTKAIEWLEAQRKEQPGILMLNNEINLSAILSAAKDLLILREKTEIKEEDGYCWCHDDYEEDDDGWYDGYFFQWMPKEGHWFNNQGGSEENGGQWYLWPGNYCPECGMRLGYDGVARKGQKIPDGSEATG